MNVVKAADHIGELQAWDLKTGQKVWTYKFKYQNWGPVLTTAGGFVFSGGSNDRYFRAFDAKNGECYGNSAPTLVLPGSRVRMQSMACSTLLCSLAGAWMHSACKDGSIRSTARPPGYRRAGCCGSSPSVNRPCQLLPSSYAKCAQSWAHINEFTLFLLRFDHPCNIPAVLYLVGGLHPHSLLQVAGHSLLAAHEDRRVWLTQSCTLPTRMPRSVRVDSICLISPPRAGDRPRSAGLQSHCPYPYRRRPHHTRSADTASSPSLVQ